MLRGVGEFARFRCRYDHSQLPRDVLSVFWLHDSQRFHMTGRHQLSRNNLTLRLENVQLADAGRWTCVVSAVVAQGQASLVLHVGMHTSSIQAKLPATAIGHTCGKLHADFLKLMLLLCADTFKILYQDIRRDGSAHSGDMTQQHLLAGLDV